MKLTLALILAVAAAPAAFGQGFAEPERDRNPIIYNSQDNEVAVIQHRARIDGVDSVVVLPTQKYLDLGYYDIALPVATLRPRPAGGWYTSLSNLQLANIRALGHDGRVPFWWSSGN